MRTLFPERIFWRWSWLDRRRPNRVAFFTFGPENVEGNLFLLFPFPIGQSFQSIKPQLHGQRASPESSPLRVPSLTPWPGLGAAVRAQQECICGHALPTSVSFLILWETQG